MNEYPAEAKRDGVPQVRVFKLQLYVQETDKPDNSLMSGPRFDIIVGKDKKHCSLPRDLLSYYSMYFHRCFNGAFKEAKEQKLELLEDTVDDFEILLEYMLHHSVPTCTEAKAKEKGGMVTAYMSIISYADKYAMGSIFCDLLYGKLKERLSGYARTNYQDRPNFPRKC